MENPALGPADPHPHFAGRWAAALAQHGTAARDLRTELAAVHWYPCYAFLRASGLDADSAAERLEGGMTAFLEEDAADPAAATPLLRERLLALAKTSLADPEPRAGLLSIDREWAEESFATEGGHPPGETFARRWTLGMIAGVLGLLEAEYAEAGKSAEFTAMQPMLGYSGGAEGDEPYAQLAAQLGVSDGAARRMVFDLRKRYREFLQAAVADTVASEDLVAGELQSLLVQLPSPGATAPPRSIMRRVNPEELLARGMNSVQMSTAGGLGWTPPTLEQAAQLFPGYEVVAMLGHGGMGAVYQARQQSLDRLVALKLLPLEISVDPSFADRFRREARAMAKLNHPNIISVYDFGQTPEGHLFFAMEYVDGAMLHDFIHADGSNLSAPDALAILEQLCDALAYAHEQGIVHRDIKPANVMIDRRGHAKIADFGLARLTDPKGGEQWGNTMTGVVMGTPDYMSPEQKRGLHVDHRADLYALGVLLYEALCKETPQGAFEMPSKRCGLPKEVDAIITRAIAPHVEHRFQSAVEMKHAITTVKPSVIKFAAKKQPGKGTKTIAPSVVPITTATPAPERNPLVLWGSIAAGVVILGVAGALVFGSKKKPASKVGPKVATKASVPTPSASAATPLPNPGAKPAAATAASTAARPVGAIDLLAGVNVQRDSLFQTWRLEGGVVKSPLNTGSQETIMLPTPNVPANYDLRYRITREKPGYMVRFFFAQGDGGGWVGFDGTDRGDAEIRGFSQRAAVEKGGGKIFKTGATHEVLIQVRESSVTALLDGQMIVRAEGRASKNGQDHKDFNPPASDKPPSIGLSHSGGPLIVHEATLVPVSAGNELAPPAPALAAAKPGDVLTFGGHRYQLVMEKLTWDEAKAKAEAMGGHLATISSKEEHEWLVATMLDRFKQLGTKDGLFLGAHRKSVGVAWEWIAGEPFGVTAWGNGKPDNDDKSEVGLQWSKLGWDDVAKGVTTPNFLVEWDDDGTAKPAAIAAAAQSGKPVDLLALVDVKRDASKGEWALAPAGVVSKKSDIFPILEIEQSAPVEYDFEIEFTIVEGAREVSQALAVRGGTVFWQMGFGAAGEETFFCFGPYLDGKKPNGYPQASLKRARLKSGQRYRSLVEVRKDSLRALIDGVEVLKWTDDFKRFGNPADYCKFKDTTHLGLASYKSDVTFHKAELRPITAAVAPAIAAAPEPAAPAAKVQTEMEKWLAQVDGPQQESYQRDVVKPFETGLAELQKSYIAALESRIAGASTAGQLDVALGWRKELQRFREGGQAVPAEDADLATVSAPFVAKALPPLRTQFRAQKAKLEAERLARAKAAFAKYDAVLSPNITLLTQRQRLDDALLLKTKRDEVQKAWLPAPGASAPAPSATPSPAAKPVGAATPPSGAAGGSTPPAAEIKGSSWRAAALWCLESKGGYLHIIQDGKDKTVATVKDLPAGRFDIATLYIPPEPGPGLITDATLTHLNGLRDLTKFNSGAAEVAGPGLEVFRTTPKLQELSLNNAKQLKDEHLAPLGALKELKELTITGSQFTGAVLQHLAACKKLETLNIAVSLTAEQAGTLHTLFPALKSLRLGPGSLTKETLSVVGQFKWLETLLFFDNVGLTDEMLAPLSGLTALRELDFGGCPKFNGTGLTAFSASAELRHLNVTYGEARVIGPALPVIVRTFPKLEKLQVMVRNATDEDFKALCAHPSLMELQLYATPVPDTWLAAIATLPKLRVLVIGHKTHSAAGIEHLLQSKSLTTLILNDANNMDASVVPVLKKFKNLKSLVLKGTPANAATDEIKKALPGCNVSVQ